MLSTSTLRMTKQSKFNMLAGSFAIHIARQKKDPLYEKLIRFKKAYRLVKKQLISKYGSRGQQAARQAAMHTGETK
jgi:hypothetical protein